MKVSYLIPLYNKQDFVVEAIKSALDEETEELEVEICIVDDGSTDSSVKVVEQLNSELGNRLRFAAFPRNRGKVAALNEAYRLSSGDVIFPLGADDVLVPGRTTRLLEEARKTRKSVCGEMVSRTHPLAPDLRRYSVPKPLLNKVALSNYYSGGCMAIWRTHAESIFPIPEHLRFEDWWIAYHLVRENQLTTCHEVVLIYRIHGMNDYATLETSVESLARDFRRHNDIIDLLMASARNNTERRYLRRAGLIRRAFFGEAKIHELMAPPYDTSTVQTAVLMGAGQKAYLRALHFKAWASNLGKAIRGARS